ncbi:DUF6907 domain-containing protein [Dactylosporangium sp. CA-152071]|uniref:DUF6907 domain-containing protein n=1 Tax=Dactylosporangium sp. CA-152071 TaxID=3239933 RepID=UPI003D8A7F75
MSTATLTTAPACPPWCTQDLIDDDGAVLHESAPEFIEASGGKSLIAGSVSLRLNRYDLAGLAGVVAVSVDSHPDGVDLNAAELRQLAAAALNLADQIEETR